MKYTTILFDADHTLFDFPAAEHQAFNETMAHFGMRLHPVAEQDYTSINIKLWAAYDRGEVTQEFLVVERFRKFFALIGASVDPAEANNVYLEKLGKGNQLYDGALELCQELSKKFTLGLATNGVAEVQRSRLALSPITACFSGIFISGELGVSKPNPAFFDATFKEFNISDKSSVVMIGDSLTADIQGGVNAGIDTIWFNPKGLDVPESPAPTHSVANYDELRALLV